MIRIGENPLLRWLTRCRRCSDTRLKQKLFLCTCIAVN